MPETKTSIADFLLGTGLVFMATRETVQAHVDFRTYSPIMPGLVAPKTKDIILIVPEVIVTLCSSLRIFDGALWAFFSLSSILLGPVPFILGQHSLLHVFQLAHQVG